MKNLKVFIGSIFVLCVVVTAIYSCSDNETQNSEVSPDNSMMAKGNLREGFLGREDFAFMKKEFNALSIAEKCALWDEKIDQLLSLQLPAQHLTLITELKAELQKHKEGRAHQIRQKFEQLSVITPDEDFIQMFFEMKDYSFSNNTFIGTGSSTERLRNYVKQDYAFQNTNVTTADCNCAYTCNSQAFIFPHTCYTSTCNPTLDGCGPFGMSECDGLLYIC